MQAAVNVLFKELGSVNKISAVYETPALGFDGGDFLNCVVEVSTIMTSSKTLKTVLAIEKKLGRERAEVEGYTSRVIDIDILLYNDDVIESKSLQVPHPRIQERKFVLQPLVEINSSLFHPSFKQSFVTLLEQTSDTSTIVKQSKWLRNPRSDYDFSNINYIAIEGNIGAGKTSLAHLISNDFNAKLILERFKDNPFLPKFYEDQQRYAFPLEMSFLADRYQQLLEDIKQFDLFKDYVVADYDVYKSLIFAKVTLQPEEYNLYKKLFHLMHKELAKPDVYIYLYQNTERLLANIKKRGRSYEKSIEAEYLQKINDGYLEYIKNTHNDNIKIIDISEMDFVKNRAHYISILEQILH
ncbi:2-amino-4-hydroxy-6-hydroxymethyldihydropteridine diphosphokinase [Patiriisocius marinus]|uniref:2-amino-4-hydroxy-6-hydroxymethyldihydropteridine pyrophosphokinase n=1 Tax=Patiriisocius marinus TaxID=1397112 RepID=A0A5J4ISI5_9FLAO|nr:2-amino-4-hydroxy-6-hydroxymethyldihydropteridine diphosphokinase [Patiriisocius marinus]